jgi:uncharacterized tellurite resistance protein B-like protein
MLDRIFSFLKSPASEPSRGFAKSDVAVVALLVRAAMTDTDFSDSERETIRRLAGSMFHMEQAEIEQLIAQAQREESETLDLHRWSQVIKQNHDEAARIGLIEKMWEVVYADGHLDDYEANLLRRVAGLIYVPDRASGEARKRVLARLDKVSRDA